MSCNFHVVYFSYSVVVVLHRAGMYIYTITSKSFLWSSSLFIFNPSKKVVSLPCKCGKYKFLPTVFSIGTFLGHPSLLTSNRMKSKCVHKVCLISACDWPTNYRDKMRAGNNLSLPAPVDNEPPHPTKRRAFIHWKGERKKFLR